MANTWIMEEAKSDFATVARAAYAGGAQYIKDGSKPVLVLTAQKDLEQPKISDEETKKDFVDFLFSIPKGEPFIDEKGRQELNLRDIDF